MTDQSRSGSISAQDEVDFEPVFNPHIYRKNEAFQAFDEAALRDHFYRHGIAEGRIAADSSVRDHFVARAGAYEKILEIGPFCNPILKGPNVKYFDVLDGAALERRAKKVGYPIVEVPAIDFVSPSGDLSIIDETFDLVISSHVVEHQPDLIHHLNAVCDILKPSGFYFLLIPDKRYCFDYFIDQSGLPEICAAHADGRTVHSLQSVIEHRALITHNDCGRHWQGDHTDGDYFKDRDLRIRAAIDEYEKSEGAYIDVHAWQFTPQSFEFIIASLKRLKLIALSPLRVYHTPRGCNEFTAILKK
ncbi:methyltransferase domain-containing protein [Fulvimarina sp. MAC8]|uniref:class I SAM-dependent methyltransferase n=1 Tax=Fulvimarina sp. MAC8 TaxID=3162874 RepID=UPI0032F04730